MMCARQTKEIVIEIYNEIGVLFNIAKAVSEKGVNIVALSAGVQGANAVVRLITDDNLRAADVLREKDYKPRETDAIIVEAPHRTGILESVARRLGEEDIDIHHIYATADMKQNACMLVLSTANNDRAVVALNR